MSAGEFRGSSATDGIRQVQLLAGHLEWRSFVDGSTRDARHFLHSAGGRVWLEPDDQGQGTSQRDCFLRNHRFVALVGIPCGHEGSTEGHHADVVHLLHHYHRVQLCQVLLGFHDAAILQRTFVRNFKIISSGSGNNFEPSNSISGGSATIYAYLGEFHNLKTRSRCLMGGEKVETSFRTFR